MKTLLRLSAVTLGLALAAGAVRTDSARAAWPPPENADFTDPANWPNDPDYKGRWNYWSFLPKQDPNVAPYLSADVKLGASGMSLDKAWTITTGRPDVKIAVLDSGIKWDEPDLANKVALNAAELVGAAKPLDAQGVACGGSGPLAGYDCNGDGLFTVADYRDDPRISPTVTGEKCNQGMDPEKPTMTDRIQGDVNRNCILDPGDLILLFSNGKDDDDNGYVDDIAGWDFYKNDNDPYDDTRYGHGTGEAKDSAAEGNNMMDTIGTCPKCTFVPLRVGESFITDVNVFAASVVYAADNGAKVVQEALGTVNQTPFSLAAIDYAYRKGVVVDASMADENSRHHNMPAVANHTLPVHSIRYNGSNFRNSTTFLAFDSCTNYGGHGALSVSGTSCASEATGRMAGILGLVYAAGLDASLNLSAEEVMQVLKQSADDVDVPESRNQKPGELTFYSSKPGWDQRFNYGRANAYKAVKMVKSGLIPPEVDVVSPTWYQPIYADRVQGAVPIYGRVAAARATSYDYVVEWAPGVEPDDAQFRTIVEMKNVPGATASGGTTPLATFDPAQLDTAHTPDPDSPQRCNRQKTFCWGPNDRTVTLRVRAIAHYGAGDVGGDARRTIAIVNQKNGLDDDLLPGFPIDLGASMEGSPKMVDLDGDGVVDLVAPTSGGTVHAWSMKGGKPQELPGFPFRTDLIDGLNPAAVGPGVPDYRNAPAYKAGANGGVDPDLAREAIINAPALGDLDGDGRPEMVLTTWPGTVYVLKYDGKALTPLAGWPKRLPLVPSCPLDGSPKPTDKDCMDLRTSYARGAYASPVLVDLDKDGKLDILQAAFDGNLYAWKADGTNVAGWPVRLHDPRAEKRDRVMSTPAVGDLNGDGIPDVVSGSNEEVGGGGNAGPVFAVDGRGMNAPGGPYLPNWPIARTAFRLFPVVGTGIAAAPALADFDGDGKPEVVIQGNGAPPLVVRADPGAQARLSDDPPNQLPGWKDEASGTSGAGFEPTSIFGPLSLATTPDTMLPLFSQPSVGDLDGDGTPDPVLSGGSLSLAGSLAGGGIARPFQHLLAAWSGKTGKMMPGSPVPIEDFTFLNNHAIADISGDGYPEMITGSGAYFLHAADACGNEPKGWPKFTNGWIIATSAVGDLVGDGSLAVVSATRTGYLFAWRTPGKASGVVQWDSFHHDNQNTGNYATPLGHGTPKGPGATIVCPVDVNVPPEKFEPGGCSCDAAGRSARDTAGLGVLGAVGALAFVRRRRRC
jgi:hypothetical protein